jgi:large subunit ribosomal protein L13
MAEKVETKTHIIDAKGKVLGRLAAQIAVLLRGKHKPNFVPYKDVGDFVVVKNVKEIKITGDKMKKKIYYRHTGYLGHLKETPLEKLFQKNPAEVLRRAVWGMLPKNRLRKKLIKKLKIEV